MEIKMNDLRADGISTTSGGTYGTVKIDGISTVNGDLIADKLDIDGIATINGGISGGTLDCDGTTTVKGNVDLQFLDCNGIVSIEGSLRATHALINGSVSVKGPKVEADKIECNGYLSIDGELNAEVVEAEGFIKAREIVGERVIIRSSTSRFLKFAQIFKNDLGCFDFIEATEVDLRKVQAKVVHGHNVVIGPKCEIETIDCTGTLRIDPSASVGTVTGNYTSV
jgi:cytoskeletal protein CcmA (bactofilin family)